MNIKTIASKTNSLVKYAVRLHDKGFRDTENAFIFEGEKLFFEAVRAGITIKNLIMCPDFIQKHPEFSEKYPSFSADRDIIKKITGTVTPQGVAVIAEKPVAGNENNIYSGKLLALESVSDPQNVGALIRSSHALGLSGVLLSFDCADPFSAKAVRASMGSCFHLPVFLCDTMVEAIETLKAKGFHIYAAALDRSAVTTGEAVFSDNEVTVIGNESFGVSEGVLSASDALYIDMKGDAESLNASVAGSIIAYCMTANDKR